MMDTKTSCISSHIYIAHSMEILIVLSMTDFSDCFIQTVTSRMQLICSLECSSRRMAIQTSGSWLLISTCITDLHWMEAWIAVEGFWLHIT